MSINPKKSAKSIYEKWLQMCNAGVEGGLKEVREHLLVIIYYNERDGFITILLTRVIHVS